MANASITTVPRRRGHRAAEAWFADLRARGQMADGYLFPSQLRQAFTDLPPAEQCHFLDAIGALMVLWLVGGEVASSSVNSAQEIVMQGLPPHEQDAANGEIAE